MYKYVLFDFDGTLIDTNELVVLSLMETSRHFLGKPLTQHDLNAILGKLLEDQIRYMAEARVDDMLEYYREFYTTNHDRLIREFPGMFETLVKLKSLNCKTAIVSAKGRGGIIRGLKHFNIEDYIDTIISANDITNSKPHPEPALKALEALGAKASEALLVGDSPYDILCGKNAGIATVMVNWSIFPKEDIEKCEADFYIDSPKDLITIIKSST